LIIDLFFLQPNSTKIINYSILPDLEYPLDYASLVIDISIAKEFIQDKRHTIVKNSKEEKKFIFELIKGFRSIDMSIILDKNSLEIII